MKCFVCLLSAQLRLPFSNKFLTKLFNVSQEFQSSGHHERINGIPKQRLSLVKQRFHADEIPMENFLIGCCDLKGCLLIHSRFWEHIQPSAQGPAGKIAVDGAVHIVLEQCGRGIHIARGQKMMQGLFNQPLAGKPFPGALMKPGGSLRGQILLQMLLQKALKKMVVAIPKPLVVERDQKQFFFFDPGDDATGN